MTRSLQLLKDRANATAAVRSLQLSKGSGRQRVAPYYPLDFSARTILTIHFETSIADCLLAAFQLQSPFQEA